MGIVPLAEALERAKAQGLDLAEISPNADPSVVKVLDWGKYRYEQQKLQQKSKGRQKQVELKQIRLGLKTDSHDIQVKLRAAERFLQAGHKVKVNLRFRGREITHPELGRAVLERFYTQMADSATKDQEATMTGRELSIILSRRKDAKDQNQEVPRQES